MRFLVAVAIVACSAFLISCSEEIQPPLDTGDDVGRYTSWDAAVELTVDEPDQELAKADVFVDAVFMAEGILVTVDATVDWRGNGSMTIDYGDRLEAGQQVADVHVYQFDEAGEISLETTGTVDPSSETITFDIADLSTAFVSFGSYPFERESCRPSELVQYLALTALRIWVADLHTNFDHYAANDDVCWRILRIYMSSFVGAALQRDTQVAAHLFWHWLMASGTDRQLRDNSYFDTRTEGWYRVFAAAARKRANEVYTQANCGNLAEGGSGSLGWEVTDSETSRTTGINHYRIHTHGSYMTDCGPDGNTSADFLIGVQARDTVDFNEYENPDLGCRINRVVCGELFSFTIPDTWGLYLTRTCNIGRDYDVYGEEVRIALDREEFSHLDCGCEQDGDPVACFRFMYQCVVPGDAAVVDASCSVAGGEGALEYRWDWEDNGSYDTSFSSSPYARHYYPSLGIKRVRLQVRNEAGETDTQVSTIQVAEHTECGDPTFIQLPADWQEYMAHAPEPGEENGLVARIDVPYDGSLVRADVPVFGAAGGDGFRTYRVEYGAGRDPDSWTTLATSDRAQETWDPDELDDSFGITIRGNLGSWDTGLKNYVYLPEYPVDHPVDLKGEYTLRLVVEGEDGTRAEDRVTVTVGNVVPNALGGVVTDADARVSLHVPPHAFDEAFRVIAARIGEREAGGAPNHEPLAAPVVFRGVEHRLAREAILGLAIPETADIAGDGVVVLVEDPAGEGWMPTAADVRHRDGRAWAEIPVTDLSRRFMLARGNGTVPTAASETDDTAVSVADPAVGDALVAEDFETGTGGWHCPDRLNVTDVALDRTATGDGSGCVRVSMPPSGRGGYVVMHDRPFDVRDYPVVRFEYRLPPESRVDLYARVGRRWYAVGFTDSPNEFRGRRVNITSIGRMAGVVADGNWHTAVFDLRSALASKTGRTVVDELVLADWDVTGFMKLETGRGPETVMHFDNFRIGEDPFRGPRLAVSPAVVDDFNKRNPANVFGLEGEVFAGADGRAWISHAPGRPEERGSALRLAYSGDRDDSYGGYVLPLPTVDASSHEVLALSLQGGADGLRIGLKDAYGAEARVDAGGFAVTADDGWSDVAIPLAAFSGVAEHALANISFAFAGVGAEMAATIDDVRFDMIRGGLTVDDFDGDDGVNDLGGAEVLLMSGDAALTARHTSHEGGCLSLSFGGSIGEITPEKTFSFAGWSTRLEGVDVSRMDELRLRLKTRAGGELPRVYLDDGGFRWGVDCAEYATATGSWEEIAIPLRRYVDSGVDLTHVAELQIVFEWEEMSGTVHVDDITFAYRRLATAAPAR